jgi:hypothetical protein
MKPKRSAAANILSNQLGLLARDLIYRPKEVVALSLDQVLNLLPEQ